MKTITLNKGYVALVDDEDFEFLNQWKWMADVTKSGQVYARRRDRINGRPMFYAMHRIILHLPYKGSGVDHIDRNTLNNQKANLRMASDHQNGGNRKASKNNTSGFKGVTWCKAAKRWQSQIMVHRQHYYLGLFDNPKDAALRYDEAAVLHFGQFACTNQQLGLLA